MTDQEKIEILKEGISELFDTKLSEEITLETEFSQLGLDSLNAVELQLFVEEKLNTRLVDPAGSIKTVSDFLILIP